MATLPPFLKNFSLEGRTALLTGGTGGIGIAVAQAYAESGADVISLQLPQEPLDIKELVENAGRKCFIYHCDLLDLEKLSNLVDEACEAHAPSILVNIAGINHVGPAENMEIQDIERVIRLNTTASIVTSTRCAKYWLANPSVDGTIRKIIHFGSITGFTGNHWHVPYAASKGAVLNMTRAMSNDWAGQGINTNCVAPGYTKSRMSDGAYQNEKFNKKLYTMLPIKHWGTGKDLAVACVYLASPGSDYVTGTCLVVDGGVLGGLPVATALDL